MKRLLIIPVLLLVGIYMIPKNHNYETICEDTSGQAYLIQYKSPERYDLIEEIHMCEGERFIRVGE